MGKFITPVAMKVTQDEYERDLKEPLKILGYTSNDNVSINNHFEYLVTNFGQYHNYLDTWSNSGDRYFIKDYNPELFLALSAMQSNDMPIKGEYIRSLNSWYEGVIPKEGIHKVTSINNDGFSIDGREDDIRQQTSLGYVCKATKKKLLNILQLRVVSKRGSI